MLKYATVLTILALSPSLAVAKVREPFDVIITVDVKGEEKYTIMGKPSDLGKLYVGNVKCDFTYSRASYYLTCRAKGLKGHVSRPGQKESIEYTVAWMCDSGETD